VREPWWEGGASAMASCVASRNFVKTRTPMESYVAVSTPWGRENLLSIYFVVEWHRLDWFLVALFLVVAVILSLMLHLPLE
jgi:hypothetical protein